MSPLICSATSSFCKKKWVLLVKHYRIILLFFCPWCPLVVAFFLQVSVSSLFVQFHLSCFILPFQPQNMIQTFCCLHIFNFPSYSNNLLLCSLTGSFRNTTPKYLFSISVYLSLFDLYWPLPYWVAIFTVTFSLLLLSTPSLHDHSSQGTSHNGV